MTSEANIRLQYLTANAAYVFTFGDQLLRMGDREMFFASRREAVAAAAGQRLSVRPSGNVYAEGDSAETVVRHGRRVCA